MVELHYGECLVSVCGTFYCVYNTVECNHPRYVLTNEQFIIIKENYSVHNISFRCNGSVYTITCMENGEWELDPTEMHCRGNKSL